MKSPIGRVLGLGSAKAGVEHWWSQRLTAVALALLGLWFAVSLATLDSFLYMNVIDFVRRPVNTVLLSLLAATMAFHSSLGIQVIIEDYVHAPALKLVSLVASRFAHIVLGIAAVYSVLRIGLGA